MSNATLSNAGDRYHFVYVARRMLDLLPPGSDLQLIQMENVSSRDQVLACDPDELLGVDLTEYYGGEDFQSASKSVIVQVKYSPIHPNATWTLNRLSKNKTTSRGTEKPGSSVLRKSANAFSVAYRALGEECRNRFQIRLFSNQPVDEQLKKQIVGIQELLASCSNLSDPACGRQLSTAGGETAILLQELKQITNLSWKRLSAFLRCWDLAAFGQPMSTDQEIEFANLLDQFVDAGLCFGKLINFVQEHALPTGPHSINKKKVYGLLQTRETSFFPAPPVFAPVENLLVTESAKYLIDVIDESPHKIVRAHGLSGTGKSTTLRLIQQEYADRKVVVIYDCYAGGEGLSTGRFPYKKFFVQVINEMEARLHTNIFATTQIDDDELMRRFELAVKKAAQLATNTGQQLIIAVDALDDAVEAVSDQPNRRHESFIPYLWSMVWPDNCILVVSARTENLGSFDIQDDFTEAEIEGFTERESVEYLQYFWPEAPDELLIHTHKCTNGNPRVQAELVELANREPPADFFAFVDEQAQQTAFRYYEEQVPKRLQTQADTLLLTILREATQFISLDTLAAIARRDIDDVRSVIERLHFGLRISPGNEIFWANKDFGNFVRRFAQNQVSQARSLLAEYCQSSFGKDSYADQNLSRHFYLAQKYRQLLDWWMTENRLTDRMAAIEPHHVEDVLNDIQYSLLASLEIQDFGSALVLLSIAAEIVQGVDVFSDEAKRHLKAVIDCNYLSRMLPYLRKREQGSELMGYYFTIARMLAEHGEQMDTAKELIEAGFWIHDQSKRGDQPEARFNAKMIADLCLYAAFVYGLDEGLRRMTACQPTETVNPLYTGLVRDWIQRSGEGEEALAIITQHDLDQQQRAYCLLGLLTSPSAGLRPECYRNIAHEVLDAFEAGLIQSDKHQWISSQRENTVASLIETLLAHKVTDAAIPLLDYWSVPAVEDHDSQIARFVERKAVEVVLGLTDFDPDCFDLTPSSKDETLTEYQQREHKEKLERTRYRMRFLYLPALCRVESLSGESDEHILRQITAYLDKWRGRTQPYWYRYHEYRTAIGPIARHLLEAVIRLPGYHPNTVKEIIEVTDGLLGSHDHIGHTRYADILSRNEKYYAEAERLIYRRIQCIEAPGYRAHEAVETLLDLCSIAARFDLALAQRIFIQARIEASGWDRHVDGLAFALLSTLEHSEPVGKATDDQLSQLISVFQFIKWVTEDEDVETHLDWFVRLLTRIRPNLVLHTIRQSDRTDFLDLEDVIDAVALGMLDTQQVPTQSIYPLVHVVSYSGKGIEVFKQTIQRIKDSGNSVDDALATFAKYVRLEVTRSNREQAAREFGQWADEQGLSDHHVVQGMRAFADELGALNRAKSDGISSTYTNDPSERSEQLVLRFEEAMADSPQAALHVLVESDPDNMRWLRYERMQSMMRTMVGCLRSADIPILFRIIEKYAAVHYEPYAFRLISQVASRTPSPERLREAYIDSLNRLLTSRNIHLLTRWYYREHFTPLLDNGLLDESTKLGLLLRAAANTLQSLQADGLYRLAGLLSVLLSPDDSRGVFETLLERATSKLKTDFEPIVVPLEVDTFTALIQFLTYYLGHPEQVKRWEALYSLVDIALNAPEATLPVLVAELADGSHERWMTKRVWLLFLFHHLSLRCPVSLVPYKDAFLHHALDKQFPHAKMRYRAQQVLLNIETIQPGTLAESELEHVRNINRPIAYITRGALEDRDRSYTGVRWSQRGDKAFGFDSLDTLPYWYSGLGHVFGGHRCHVADIAYKWIVEEWGVTDAKCDRLSDWTRSKYEWEDTSNRQGCLPKVEMLQTYAERHGMFMAAGELIDSQPVLFDDSWGSDRWEDWMRYNLRAADPLLVSRYLRDLPMTADNYGFFASDYEEWSKKDVESEYEQELWVDDSKQWLIVEGHRSGSFSDREFSVSVCSFLVHPETSHSLARFVNSQDDFIALPYTHGPYDSILQEIANDLAEWWNQATSQNESIFNNEINEHPFVLLGWTVDWGQEMPLHAHDPKWAGIGRGLGMFAPNFYVQQEVRFDPMTLEWCVQDDEKIAYSEVWQDSAGRGSYGTHAYGSRLIVRRDLLVDYLNRVGMDIVFTVRLSRSRPYNRGYKGQEYDKGTVRAYILGANDKLESAMDQELIEKANALMEELGEDRQSTLQRWMAHYLVELMERASSADEQEAQAGSKECAEIVAKLWEQKTEQEATQLRNRLWQINPLPSDDFDYGTLADAVNDPTTLRDLNAESWIKVYHALSDAEYWLLRVSAIAHVINVSEDEAPDESMDKFLEQERGKKLVDRLAKLFSDFEGLDVTDADAVQQQVTSALRQVYQLRFSLLWRDDEAKQ